MMPSFNTTGTIDLSGNLTLAINEAAWFQIDRNANFSLASLAALNIDNIEDVPLEENTFIFAIRASGTEVWLWDGIELQEGQNLTRGEMSRIINDNSYEEVYTVVAPIPAHTLLSLPMDTRTTPASIQAYVVGKGVLELYLNGIMLELGDDWNENGTVGLASTDLWIEIPLVAGDELKYRIDVAGGYVGAGPGGGEANIGANVGIGTGLIYRDKTGINLNLRTLKQGAGVTITTAGDEVTIAKAAGTTAVFSTVIATPYAVSASDDVVLVNVGIPSTINLPQAALSVGKILMIKKIDAGGVLVTIDAFGAETIDGSTTLTTTVQNESFTLGCNGTSWYIL